jgi:glycosyltransferase involved in cell wall biosynthesis
MNIWYLSAHDQPRGQSSRTYDFCRELIKRGHQTTMFTNSYCHWTHQERLTPGEKWRIEEIDGIRVVWLRTIHYTGNGVKRGLNMLSNAWRCLQVARSLDDKPDVVVGPSVPLGTGWAAARIAKRKRAAFVFEVRDVWPIALVDDGGLSKQNPVYHVFRCIEKQLYRKAQRISATMPLLFDHVRESGSDPDKVTWIPNGVNFDRFAGFEEYGGGTSLPLVAMYIGGFGAAHDVITIIRSAAILQRDGCERFRFVIVGDGIKRSECMREAQELGLSNIDFRDPIDKSDIPRTQMESDVLIACVTDSAAYRFGLNLNKLYDYFASARPAIFSGNAPNDPIAESCGGVSIPPENPTEMAGALRSILDLTPIERIAMGKRGQEYVKNNFDMGKLAERMELLLQEAVKAKDIRK